MQCLYTYLKEYFYFVYYFELRRALACCVMLLLGDREVRECQEVTFTKDILSAGGQSQSKPGL